MSSSTPTCYEVFGVINPRFVGAYAEYAIVAAGMVARKPASLDHIEASPAPVVAVTAWQALHAQGSVTPGQTVLIQGGAGNVGAYAVQLAKRAGARVIATTGARDVDFVRRLGNDTVVDYNKKRFKDVAEDVDLVLDFVGSDTQTRSFGVSKRGGKMVSAVSGPDPALATAREVTAHFFLVAVNTADLAQIGALFDEGRLTMLAPCCHLPACELLTRCSKASVGGRGAKSCLR